MEAALKVLPLNIAELIHYLPDRIKANMEEIRLRVNRQVEVFSSGQPHFLPYIFTKNDADLFISHLADHSFYTIDEELKRGYITIGGGHRIGLAGEVILEDGRVKALRHLSSFNIRVAREKIGVAEHYIPYLYDGERWMHTMIIGPPQTGKTTLLRDLARLASSGFAERKILSQKVGIVDERSEIAGSVEGVPQLELGPRVDVLDACPKAEGMMMMIRALSPDVIIIDEIGREEDKKAILEAVNAGIILMMSTHGNSLADISKRPLLREIVEQGVFERYIELSRGKGPGTVVSIKNIEGQVIYA